MKMVLEESKKRGK